MNKRNCSLEKKLHPSQILQVFLSFNLLSREKGSTLLEFIPQMTSQSHSKDLKMKTK